MTQLSADSTSRDADTEARFSAALAEAAAVVNSSLHVEQVLDRILEQVTRVVPSDTSNIMLIVGDGVRIVRWRGYEAIGISDDDISRIRPIASSYGTFQVMMETGQPIVVHDTMEATTWVSSPGRVDHRAYVGAPIWVDGKVEGFINANGSRPGQFSRRDAEHLKAFADHAAIALRNARLYEKTRQYAEELERRVEERTRALQARTAWVEAILRNTSDGIIVTDPNGTVVEMNPVATRWIQYSLPPEDATALRRAIKSIALHATERDMQSIELTDLDLELHAAPIAIEDGAVAGVVVAVHDVTHLRTVDRMRSQFISDISHELRTPITTIRLYTALLRDSPEDKRDKYFASLDQETSRIADLVGAILKIARIESGRLELAPTLTDINVIVSSAARSAISVASAKGLQVVQRIAANPVWVLADPYWFIEAVDNVVRNALLYTIAGEIRISTGTASFDGTDWATCTVEDTGIGIPLAEQPRIFERFFRGEEVRAMSISGNGLGLVIARAVVERHGGTISLSSTPGEGTRVTIHLPLAMIPKD